MGAIVSKKKAAPVGIAEEADATSVATLCACSTLQALVLVNEPC